MYWNISFTYINVIMILLFYEKKCIKSLINKCGVHITLIYWNENKLIVIINQNISWVIVLQYTLLKFWRYFAGQSFYVSINVINDTGLPFHEYWYIYTIFFGVCIKQSLRLLIIVDLVFFHEILSISLVHYCQWSVTLQSLYVGDLSL